MSENGRLIELTDLVKRYDSPDAGGGATVLNGVSLTVARGQSLAIIGPSGSGKSTLLNLIGALDKPTSGRVVIDGQDLCDLSDRRLAEIRNRRIGFVFQLHHLLAQCTALENVLVPTLARGGSDERAGERAKRLLERVGLSLRMNYRPGQLSGGERQRVALVRALINEPDLLLADEPTGSLDGKASDELADLLVELNREDGVTLVVVTHSQRLAERMGRRLELRDGRLTDGAIS